MNREKLPVKQLRKLEAAVTGFVDKLEISCGETVYQCDRVILGALEFIDELCEIVGYHEYEEDE